MVIVLVVAVEVGGAWEETVVNSSVLLSIATSVRSVVVAVVAVRSVVAVVAVAVVADIVVVAVAVVAG